MITAGCENPSMPVADLAPVPQRWECHSCALKISTRPGRMTPMHDCAGHNGFRIPFVPYQSRDQVHLIERDDYIGGDDVRTDADGRPFMRAEVERDADGHTDVWVFAPTAYADGRPHG